MRAWLAECLQAEPEAQHVWLDRVQRLDVLAEQMEQEQHPMRVVEPPGSCDSGRLCGPVPDRAGPASPFPTAQLVDKLWMGKAGWGSPGGSAASLIEPPG